MTERVAIVGLGYVGLPVALAFARKFEGTVGFDISEARIDALRANHDWTGEVDPEGSSARRFSSLVTRRSSVGARLFIVAVPTPLDADKQPDLGPLLSATRTVGGALAPGAVVVYESTVYPGLTEEHCGPLLAETSGLAQSQDFKLGYSPERINPGDKLHTFERIIKVVSGEDAETLERVAAAYEAVVDAGVHRASSIKVAEAAKVIENTQRDVNIALMNELALIFDRLDIRTRDVLEAAGTKWNFLPFTPGLVGGHCIGVDPYYLTAKAESLGYRPEVILAGRRINDGMGQLRRRQEPPSFFGRASSRSRALASGCSDSRSKRTCRTCETAGFRTSPGELREHGVEPIVHDPLASARKPATNTGSSFDPSTRLTDLDGLILAVAHDRYLDQLDSVCAGFARGGLFVDVKSASIPRTLRADLRYWSL